MTFSVATLDTAAAAMRVRAHDQLDTVIERELECRRLYLAGNYDEYRRAYERREEAARTLRNTAWDIAALIERRASVDPAGAQR